MHKIVFLGVAMAALLTACQNEVNLQDLNSPGSGGASNNTEIVLIGNWKKRFI